MRPLHAAIVLALLALSLACKSDAEKIVDLRTELRTKLDGLYDAYGGGDVANQAKAGAQRDGDAREGLDPGRLIGQLDRSYFEGFCLARGRGERPFSLSGKLDTFMKDPANERACRDAAKLSLRLEELESKAPPAQKP